VPLDLDLFQLRLAVFHQRVTRTASFGWTYALFSASVARFACSFAGTPTRWLVSGFTFTMTDAARNCTGGYLRLYCEWIDPERGKSLFDCSRLIYLALLATRSGRFWAALNKSHANYLLL
jgi:hypothetical protein